MVAWSSNAVGNGNVASCRNKQQATLPKTDNKLAEKKTTDSRAEGLKRLRRTLTTSRKSHRRGFQTALGL
jgi:hypothetical protein